MDFKQLERCIAACHACAAHCDRCATACLQEENIAEMRKCTRLNISCAALCRLAASLMALDSNEARDIGRRCAQLCRLCAKTCGMHTAQHCQQCAEACYRCADECEHMAATA